jgi:hypothetical protein
MEKTFIIGSCRVHKPFQLLSNELKIPLNCDNFSPDNYCHYTNEIIQYISFFYRNPPEFLLNRNCINIPPDLSCKHVHNANKYIIEISSIKNIIDSQLQYLNIVKVKKQKLNYRTYLESFQTLVDNILVISYLLDDRPILFVSHFNPGNKIPNRQIIIDAIEIAQKYKKNIKFLNPTKFVEKLTPEKAILSPEKPTEYSPEMLNIIKDEFHKFIYSN